MTTASGMGSGSVSTSKRKVSRTETNPASLDRGRSGISHRIKTRSKGQGKARQGTARDADCISRSFTTSQGLSAVMSAPRTGARIAFPCHYRGWPSVQKLRGDHVPRCKIPLRLRQSFSRPATGVPWRSREGMEGGRLGKGSPRGTERVENPVRRKDNVSRESSSSIFLAAAQNRARSGSLAS